LLAAVTSPPPTRATSLPVAIVSDAFVREYFAVKTRSIDGCASTSTHVNGRDDVEWVVIGVVRDVRSSLDGAAGPTTYVPTTQLPGRACAVRAHRTGSDVGGAGRDGVIRAMEPQAPVGFRRSKTLSARPSRGRARLRCWSARSRSWRSRLPRSASTA
jgi:hypothetical protein